MDKLLYYIAQSWAAQQYLKHVYNASNRYFIHNLKAQLNRTLFNVLVLMNVKCVLFQ